MKKEIEEQIKTLRDLAKSKRKAAKCASCWRTTDRLNAEADNHERQADELEKANKD